MSPKGVRKVVNEEMTLTEVIRLIEVEKEKGYTLEEIIALLKRIADKS